MTKIINKHNLAIPELEKTHDLMKKYECCQKIIKELDKEQAEIERRIERHEAKLSVIAKQFVLFNVNIQYEGSYHLFSNMEEAKRFAREVVAEGVKESDVVIEITNDFDTFEYIDLEIHDPSRYNAQETYKEYLRIKKVSRSKSKWYENNKRQ